MKLEMPLERLTHGTWDTNPRGLFLVVLEKARLVRRMQWVRLEWDCQRVEGVEGGHPGAGRLKEGNYPRGKGMGMDGAEEGILIR